MRKTLTWVIGAMAGLVAAGAAQAGGGHTAVSSDGTALSAPLAVRADANPFRGTGFVPDLPLSQRTAAPVTGARDPLLGYGLSVIGPDGRVRVTNTTSYPYRAIVQIVRVSGGSTWGCTGWLIGKDTVATAGHCVAPGSGGTFYPASSITVYPGKNGTSTPYGSCKPRRLYSVTGWTQSGSEHHDYGAIKLNCTIGDRVGWFGYFKTASSLTGRAARVTGYPCDKTFGTMWTMGGSITASNTTKVFYKMDTYGCQSGSPVYETRSSGPFGMGIHAYGGTSNSGTRINSTVFTNLSNWKNAP